MTPEVAASDVHLFGARDAVRYRYGRGGRGGAGAGDNPPRGAVLHYFLKEKPKGELKLEILDGEKVVNTFTSKAEPAEESSVPARFREGRTVLTTEPGVNRVVWNLNYTGPVTIKGASGWPGAPTTGPLVNPGTYQVRLSANGQTLTAKLTVRPDPRVSVPPGDLAEQLRLALAVRDQISQVTQLVGKVRGVRTQLAGRIEAWKDNPRAAELVRQAKELTTKLDALEANLHNPKAEIPYDLLAHRGGAKLYSQLSALFGAMAGSDGLPTQGMRELHAEQTRELEQWEAEWNALVAGDLVRFNETAKSLDLLRVTVPQKSGKP
jgi:hypothetical protein